MIALNMFVLESNMIEGIPKTRRRDSEAHIRLLWLPSIATHDLKNFVASVQPKAVLRDRVGLDVYVGDHVPPGGGPEIELALQNILDTAYAGQGNEAKAREVHIAYENLHPFTDGNGRSGRALWLWMLRDKDISSFLNEWAPNERNFYAQRQAYYESLRISDARIIAEGMPFSG